MIIDREDRAVFTDELRRRRRGRPRVAEPMVRASVRLPAPVFDAYCREALRSGRSLPEVVRETLAAGVTGQFTSSTNHGRADQW